jgi:hypothetical protein
MAHFGCRRGGQNVHDELIYAEHVEFAERVYQQDLCALCVLRVRQ